MSVKVSSWVWEHSQAKGNDRLVLLCIADIANDEGDATAHPRSISWLSRKTHLASSTVRARIKALVDLGELEVVTTGTGRTQSGYSVLMGRVPDSGTLDSEDATTRSGTQGADEPVRRVPDSGTQGADSPAPHHPVLIPSSPVSIPSAPLALVPDDVDALFDRFWALYPRKVDKKGSKRAFKKALKTAAVADVSAGLKAWLPYWALRDIEFVPHPTTWLNQERWNDPPPAATRQASMPKAAETIMRWAEGE